MRYFFFITVAKGGKNKLVPLPYQKGADGIAIDTNLNTQVATNSKMLRMEYPIGTVFCSTLCELNCGSTLTPYYRCGQIYPMLPPGSTFIGGFEPNHEMRQAWKNYQDEHGTAAEPAPEAPKRKKRTLSEPAAAPSAELFGPEKETAPETARAETRKKEEVVDKRPLLEQLRTNPQFNPPTIDKEGFYVDPKNWYFIVRNIKQKINTLLTGPSGTGKTELVMLAAKKLGIPCHVYDMGAMHDAISTLLGTHRLTGGSSKFDYARFTQQIQEPCVILLDELSRAPVTTNNILFPCLDSRRRLDVEIASSFEGEGPRSIQVHPDCVFFATANLNGNGSEYSGVNELDRALSGRFIPLELDYMPADNETTVLMKRTGITSADAANIIKVAQTVRNLYAKEELTTTISTRETLACARLVADGWTTHEALEMVFLPLFNGTRTDGERSVVLKSFGKL